MRRKSKAISPIIATLILIVITVVAGVMLYGFVTGFMAKTSSSTGAIAQIAIDSAGVSSGGLSSGGQGATISLTNTGTTSVTITQVNLLDPGTGALIATSTSLSQTTVSGGQTVTITASSFSLASGVSSYPSQGTTVLVQVVTSTGSYAETSVVVGP